MAQTTDYQPSVPHPIALWVLKAMLLILGISALLSGMALVLDPSGKTIQFPDGYLNGSPFSDYLIPGIILTLCMGVLPLVSWYALWKKPQSAFLQRITPISGKHWAWAAAMKSGIVLVIWIVVQMWMVPYFFLQPVLLSWAFIILMLCFTPAVRAFYKIPVSQNPGKK